MKTFFSISLLLLSVSAFAQQKEFRSIPNHNSDFSVPIFSTTLSEIFANPESYTKITLFPEDLDSVAYYDFSKLVNLKVLHIKFSFCPDSSDAAKKVFRETTQKQLNNLSAFSKCPNLKILIFGVGEQIYVDRKACDANADEEADYEKQYNRVSKENMMGAWDDFGKTASVLLPNVKVYGYNWGW